MFAAAAAAAAKSPQSCPTLCDPIDGSPPDYAVPGIIQARTLEWVAISFSNAWKWKVKVKSLSRVQPLATPWSAAYQAPPSMGFFRQEYLAGVKSVFSPLPPSLWLPYKKKLFTNCLHIIGNRNTSNEMLHYSCWGLTLRNVVLFWKNCKRIPVKTNTEKTIISFMGKIS